MDGLQIRVYSTVDPMKNASIEDAKRLAEFTDELVTFIGVLAAEGERSLVIGGAARIEVAVEKLLKAVMPRHARGKDDDLFAPDRPLGTFSAKIKLADRLGLLGGDVEHALQMIRKIRNDFAHATTDIRLLQPPHADRVREIVNSVRIDSAFDRIYDKFSPLVARSGRSAKRNELVASLAVAFSFIGVVLDFAAWRNEPFKAEYVANFGVRKKP